MVAQSQLGSFLRARANTEHDANLAGSSDCCTRALEGSGSAVLQRGCEKCFLRSGDCINNAVQGQYKNAKRGMLLQHLRLFFFACLLFPTAQVGAGKARKCRASVCCSVFPLLEGAGIVSEPDLGKGSTLPCLHLAELLVPGLNSMPTNI